jgi:hypothetical protein
VQAEAVLLDPPRVLVPNIVRWRIQPCPIPSQVVYRTFTLCTVPLNAKGALS